jgi:hypothetical protein
MVIARKRLTPIGRLEKLTSSANRIALIGIPPDDEKNLYSLAFCAHSIQILAKDHSNAGLAPILMDWHQALQVLVSVARAPHRHLAGMHRRIVLPAAQSPTAAAQCEFW